MEGKLKLFSQSRKEGGERVVNFSSGYYIYIVFFYSVFSRKKNLNEQNAEAKKKVEELKQINPINF